MLAGIAMFIEELFESPLVSKYSLTALPKQAVIMSLIVTFIALDAALTSEKRMSEEVAHSFFPESRLFPSCRGFRS